MIAYLDASVISSIALKDAGWEIIVRSSADHIAYSDFGLGETVSAIAIRARTNRRGTDLVEAAMMRIEPLISRWQRHLLQSMDIAEATALVARVDLALRLPDAIHVAIARRIGATLVTIDCQQYRAALALGMPADNPLETLST